jgi:hypothetical protein
MPEQEIIFVGSSTEGQRYARAVLAALENAERERRTATSPSIELRAWWHEDVFKAGEVFIESLEREAASATAAVLVFSPDDDASIREQSVKVPRDNVVFEYGMFVSLLRRPRVAIVQVDDARLPTDISGVAVIRLAAGTDDDDLIDTATRKLGSWLRGLPGPNEDLHPRLTEQLKLLAPTVRSQSPEKRDRFDRHASQAIQTQLLSILTDSLGVNRGFVKLAENELADSISISACDATGPAGWAGPAPYQYIACQVREYLFANRYRRRWQPYVHDWLHQAMQSAIASAQQCMPRRESATRFDNSGEIQFTVGVPRLQYSRILLWTPAELADPMSEQVIKLHEAFRIPLFYLPVTEASREKQTAYVAFEKRGGTVSVLYGTREHNYDAARDTSFRDTGTIPGIGHALEYYKTLLARENLMFAYDAWELQQAARSERD